MGCSAAKNFAEMENLDGNRDLENGNANRTVPISPGHPPQNNIHQLEPDDIPAELLENATVNNVLKGANGLSFEIAFEEGESEESIVKKHPPRRILERLEEPPSSPVTLDKLQEKLDEAEIRRQQILAQRVHSAKKISERAKKQDLTNSFADDEDDEFLKVPPQS
ncbi:unnamed protein product [Phaedon cochleariae]|uniref:Stathmin n=1 Tax=Phaedon cochleariae TaxID=80249 RepID=A0A9P0DWZ7_PHACE|nr:unnamed protein product [Phaedon cochleariae]